MEGLAERFVQEAGGCGEFPVTFTGYGREGEDRLQSIPLYVAGGKCSRIRVAARKVDW